ncbi:isochorismatase domain-containing protein 1-like [Ciona intestinalis]
MTSVSCLFICGDKSKVCEINTGSGKSDICSEFRKTFNLLNFELQTWDESWEVWVDVGDGFTLEDSTKFRTRRTNLSGLGNLEASSSVVFCCDMQERFRPAIKYFDEIVQVGGRVVKAAQILNIPLVVTEQYPKGLGNTVKELNISDPNVLAAKTKFSMLTTEVETYLRSNQFKSVLLFGVEAHVCVQQTAIDLISRGYEVHLVVDATSSRSLSDRQLAYQRLHKLGVFVTSAETILLQLVADKNHEKFKEIQNLVKVLPPDSGLTPKCNI